VLAKLARDPNRFLATIQIGIILAGFLASATAAVSLAKPIVPLLSFLDGASTAASGALPATATQPTPTWPCGNRCCPACGSTTRHTHKTWMIEDDIPEVAQCDRLGHALHGIRGVYSHTTTAMITVLLNRLQQRWTTAIGTDPDDSTPRAA